MNKSAAVFLTIGLAVGEGIAYVIRDYPSPEAALVGLWDEILSAVA